MKVIDTFQNRLKKAMEINGIKQVELVEKTKLDKTLINKYLSGVSNARQNKLTILADALNVNEVWLMGYDVSMDRKLKTDELGNPIIEIPLLGSVKAGYNHLAQEAWLGTIKVDTSIVGNNKEEYFALNVKGDSMSPFFMEGDIVIIHKQNDCENNDFAVVIINGDEGTLKMVKKTNFGIILQPLNTSYEPIAYTNEEIESIPVQIAGVVVKSERIFKR